MSHSDLREKVRVKEKKKEKKEKLIRDVTLVLRTLEPFTQCLGDDLTHVG